MEDTLEIQCQCLSLFHAPPVMPSRPLENFRFCRQKKRGCMQDAPSSNLSMLQIQCWSELKVSSDFPQSLNRSNIKRITAKDPARGWKRSCTVFLSAPPSVIKYEKTKTIRPPNARIPNGKKKEKTSFGLRKCKQCRNAESVMNLHICPMDIVQRYREMYQVAQYKCYRSIASRRLSD